MNYASVCSGAEAFGPAWHELGFKPVFHAEIEPHASAVLRYHYPTIPNYGDFTQIATPDGPCPDEPVRLLCGGTPCQTYSVAGLREGLDSYKGGLTLEFVKLAKRLNADWLLWENVPGVLSADGGRAFGTFLGTLAECGYGFAYRVLDLQNFGCPQRRKRVFLVAHSGGDWQSCAAVLFESESLRGNPAPGRKAGQDVTGTLSSRTNAGGGLGTDFDCAGGLVAYDGNQITSKTNRSNPQPGGVCHTLPAKATAPLLTNSASAYVGNNCSGEIKVATCLTTGNQRLDFDTETFLLEPAPNSLYQDSEYGVAEYPTAGTLWAGRIPAHQMVVQPIAKVFQQNSRDELRYIQGNGQATGALSADAGMHQQNFIHVEPAIAFTTEQALTLTKQSPTGGGQIQSVCVTGTVAHTLTAQAFDASEDGTGRGTPIVTQPAIAYGISNQPTPKFAADLMPTLDAKESGGGRMESVCFGSAVRRLMPTECEALMGWERDWTRYGINAKGKQYELADGPRYRICGNGWGQPVVSWIANRILMVDALLHEAT